uniref:Uncharacterized protein n=1 Tax=Strongyloides venezuelensis TaxID=75913 RepID=A0A0K0G5I3_STRVS
MVFHVNMLIIQMFLLYEISYGSLIRIFALFLFVYILIESFVSFRKRLVDYFYNCSPEHVLSNY